MVIDQQNLHYLNRQSQKAKHEVELFKKHKIQSLHNMLNQKQQAELEARRLANKKKNLEDQIAAQGKIQLKRTPPSSLYEDFS